MATTFSTTVLRKANVALAFRSRVCSTARPGTAGCEPVLSDNRDLALNPCSLNCRAIASGIGSSNLVHDGFAVTSGERVQVEVVEVDQIEPQHCSLLL